MTDSPESEASDERAEDDKTFTLSNQEIRAATQVLHMLVDVEHDRGRELTKLARENVYQIGARDRSVLIERARRTYVDRARRARIFNDGMFGEPAWDMLLALYVTDTGQRHTVSGLISLAGVPYTTAQRWLDFLEKKEELVARRPSATDGRVFIIELTEKARDALDLYFSDSSSERI